MRYTLLLLFSTVLLLSDVAVISAKRGFVKVIRGDQQIQAKTGMKLQSGDIVETGSRSKAQLIFSDKTAIRLGQRAVFEIEDYLYSKKSNSRSSLRVKRGFFNVITGAIGKVARKNFKLKLKTATIGVRGTIFQGFTADNRDEIECVEGAIVVEVDGSTVELKAGERIDSLRADSKTLKGVGEVELQERFQLELSKELQDAIVSIRNSSNDDFGTIVGNTFNEHIVTIENRVEEEYSKAIFFREIFLKNQSLLAVSSGKHLGDIAPELFENPVAEINLYESGDVFIGKLEDLTSPEVVAGYMGGYRDNMDTYQPWNGLADGRKVTVYDGYYHKDIVDNEKVVGSENTLPQIKGQKVSAIVDFGNRFIDYRLEDNSEKSYFYAHNTLSQFYLLHPRFDYDYEEFFNPVNNIGYYQDKYHSNGVRIESIPSYYGDSLELISSNIYVSYILDPDAYSYYNKFTANMFMEKGAEYDVYKESVGSDKDFSWGYWAYDTEEKTEYRGGWILSELVETPKEFIESELGTVAKYNGDVFGTYQKLGDSGQKFNGGSFSMSVNFGKGEVEGNFQFSADEKYSVDTVGKLYGSEFEITGDRLYGSGQLFGKKAEAIGGGFNIAKDSVSIFGVYKGKRE